MKDKKNIRDVKNVKDLKDIKDVKHVKNNKSGQRRKIHKKQIFIFIAIIILLLAITLIFNFNKITNYKNSIIGTDELTKSQDAQIGEKAIVTSAQEVKRITGTAPFDNNDEPGNDSSDTNDIVRSFDVIQWNIDLTLGLKSGTTETNLKGGKINLKLDLPADTADVVEWDLDSMSWIENGTVSDDGKTLTGSYTLSSTEVTIPGKQTLEFFLKTEGIGNGTEIIPTFEFNLEGNNDNEKYTYIGNTVKVSAAAKYNIELDSNSNLSNKTTLDYGNGDTKGRIYGYGFTVQLYNDNTEKGLKGLEYPKGEITFDINLKLERTKENSSSREDITNDCTPVLWNYKLNNWDATTIGIIADREMFRENHYQSYCESLPLGVYVDPDYSVYNSGNISITQENSTLKVSVKDYAFNAIFPYQKSSYRLNNSRPKIYDDNVGTFCVGYMQIFVPDNEASTIEDRNYYLTISDGNVNINSLSGINTNSQMKSSDDSISTRHYIKKPGNYNDSIMLYDTNDTTIESNYGKGDGKISIGDILNVNTKFRIYVTNDEDVYTANKFVKFDGEAFAPIYIDDTYKFSVKNMSQVGNPEFRVWYATKKDGTNWTSQTDMNNGNIEDMDIYDNIEDIPQDKLCIGIYIELIDGYLSKRTGDDNIIYFYLKVKNTSKIGQTYGITQRTQMWDAKLDRNIYSVLHPENEYPTPDFDSGNRQYVKTEYDEYGNKISGTHYTGSTWGNTVLIVGSNLHGNIQAIDSNNNEKSIYDLGKNENVVTYKVEPELDKNPNLTTQISGVTLKAEVPLPKGLTYIGQSSNYDDPDITTNSDGSSVLTWIIENCTSGDEITPITFNAQIDNETPNETQYNTKFVISEVIPSNGVAKIGNSEINFRTSSTTITVTNLASHRLYKNVDQTIMENDTELKYTIVYENKTEDSLPDFQVLDILPYNGDSRGSRFSGDYTISQINVTQTINSQIQSNANLNLYTTNSEDVKNIDAKNTEIGISNIWQTKQIGAVLNEKMTGIALKGNISGKTRLEIEIIIKTNGNKSKDIYVNDCMAQTYANSEQMQTGTVRTTVLEKRLQDYITVSTTVTVTDKMNDVTKIEFAWSYDNQTPPTNYINREGNLNLPFTLTENLEQGTHYLWVKATDSVGNVSEYVSKPFIVKAPSE